MLETSTPSSSCDELPTKSQMALLRRMQRMGPDGFHYLDVLDFLHGEADDIKALIEMGLLKEAPNGYLFYHLFPNGAAEIQRQANAQLRKIH